MAVFMNGKPLVGTERRSSSKMKKDRVREARRLWAANAPGERISNIYSRVRYKRREI